MALRHWAFIGAYLLPAIAGVYLAPSYWYWSWPLSSLLIAYAIVRAAAGSRVSQIMMAALVAITSLANLMLLASLYTQGTGFNEAFFFHLNGETFRVARNVFPLLFFGGICLWLALSLWPVVLGTGRRANTIALGGLLVLGIALSTPLHSIAAYIASANAAEEHPTLLLRAPISDIAVDSAANPRSLVLIFAESLETLYSDATVFGEDLTPHLTALANTGIHFTDIRQVQNTGWTMGGLVAAQCAVPMSTSMGANSVLANVSLPLPQEICLGDILSAYGFQTTFMGGADLGFAGKGNFLRAHGFAEVLGQSALVAEQEDPDYVSGWGVFDDQLFRAATDKLAQLSRNERPFLLSLLTLDTHHPSGYPSASCPQPQGDELLSTIRCSDRLIASFIETVRHEHPNAVVAVFSDHLSHRNDVFEKLTAHRASRRLRLFIVGGDIQPRTITAPGTHMDVLPTLMEAIGIPAYTRHNLGRSLLSAESGWFSLDNPESLILSNDDLGIDVSLGDSLVFSAKGPSINFGQQTLLATTQGLELRNDVYAVEFDEARKIRRFLTAGDFAEDKAPPKGFIVGVSNNRAFNRRHFPDGSSPLVYIAGYLNSERHTVAPLWWQETVALDQYGLRAR